MNTPHASRTLRTIALLAGATFYFGVCAGNVSTAQAPAAEPVAATTGETALVRGNKFIRVRDSQDGNHVYLEIATRSFKPATGTGATVDLVGAVHIGDSAYYAELQKLLAEYALVLFEGVKPAADSTTAANADDAAKHKLTQSRQRLLAILAERARKKHGEYPASTDALIQQLPGNTARMAGSAARDAWGNAMILVLTPGEKKPTLDIISYGSDGKPGPDDASSAADVKFSTQKPLTKRERENTGEGIQSQLADALGLEFQLTAIDYTQPTWRNSDMSVDEVQQRLEDSGASSDMLFSLLDGGSFAGKLAGLMLTFVKSSPAMAMNVKIMMTEALVNADALAARGGPGMNAAAFMKVIIVDRNTTVLNDLRQVLDNEKNITSIGIFYGAGHFADMEARLTQDFGYVFTSEQWHTAISLDLTTQPGAAAQVKQMRTMMKQMAEQATRE